MKHIKYNKSLTTTEKYYYRSLPISLMFKHISSLLFTFMRVEISCSLPLLSGAFG
jgi:hypothetical protein